ncbi:anaphase-promoting complex subunit 5-domain-containing protein [Chytriomyces sp. MP71]|nr:anaphase-promoting complex subunit 5-domain-containing protein [Chytriomyces sp. MP71]
MPRDLSPTKFLLLVIAVEFSLEYRGLLWNAPNSKPATMRFLLRSLQNPSPPHSLTPLDPLTILAQLDAIPIIANPPASLKTILLFQLEKIYALSNLDAVFDVAQAAVEGMVGGYVGLGVDQGLQNILSLSRASELGIFVRKMVLDYRTFNFDESVRFFEAVMRLRDALLSNDGAYISVTEVVTQSDADRYVDFYARYAGCTGVTLPKELAHNLMRIQEAAPDSVKVYYVQYLAAMKAENFTVALEKLHQFYDYSAVHSDKPMRQYAALDLAVLHATFAQIDKACQILDEAISVSRVLKDAECLNYCLSWAYKLQSIGGHLDGLPHDPAAHIHSHVLQSTFLAMPQLQRVGEIELARASVEKVRLTRCSYWTIALR